MTLLLPVDGIVRHFSLRDASNGDWAVQGVTLALHPDCTAVAVAQKNEVAVFATVAVAPAECQPSQQHTQKHLQRQQQQQQQQQQQHTPHQQNQRTSFAQQTRPPGSSSRVGCGHAPLLTPKREQPAGWQGKGEPAALPAAPWPLEGQLLGSSSAAQDPLTCLAWVALHACTPDMSAGGHPGPPPPKPTGLGWWGQQQQGPGPGPGLGTGSNEMQPPVRFEHRPNSSSSPSPGHAEPEECLLLLCGTAGGYLQLHSPQGRLLLRQRLHPGPMRAMQAQPGCLGQAGQAGQAGASVSGVLVGGAVTCTFADAIACVKVSELWAWWAAYLRAAAVEVPGRRNMLSASMAWAAAPYLSREAPLPPLSLTCWALPRQLKGCQAALLLRQRPRDLYTVLQRGPAPAPEPSSQPCSGVMLLVGGEAPALAAMDAQLSPAQHGLGSLLGAATQVASDMLSRAKAARQQVVQAPAVFTQSLKTLLLTPLIASWDQPSPGSGPPAVVFDEPGVGQPRPWPPTPTMWRSLVDPGRAVRALLPAPAGPWLLAPDGLGRVLLLDSSHCRLVRMWKGFRAAECGWLLLPRGLLAALRQRQSPDVSVLDLLGLGQSGSLFLTPTASSGPAEAGAGAGATQVTDRQDTDHRLSSEGATARCVPGGCDVELAPPPDGQLSFGGAAGAADDSAGRYIPVDGSLCPVAVLHAPLRQAVEIWMVPHGPCVLSIGLADPRRAQSSGVGSVESAWRLLQPGARLGGARQCHCNTDCYTGRVDGTNCILFDLVTGRLLPLAKALGAWLRSTDN